MNLEELLQNVTLKDAPRDLGLGVQGIQAGGLIFSRPFLALHAITDLYTAKSALLLAFDLGWETKLRTGATLQELLEGLQPPSLLPVRWMLAFFKDKGWLTQNGERFRLEETPDLDLQSLRDHAEREAPGHGANFDLLDAVRSHILPYFTEGRSGESLLFDLSVFPLWLDYFRNDNLIYQANNILALTALRDGLEPGSRILELGGGAGSFAQMLARDAAEQGYLDHIAQYRFTDIAPNFLRRAQRELKSLAPGLPLSFSSCNIDKPLREQGLGDIPFDVILGVNVLHVAKDLRASLQELRANLAPGGRLVLSECLKPDLDHPIYPEFFFNFMSSFTNVQTDPDFRPTTGFLTPEAWVKALQSVGFPTVRQYPEARALMEICPSFYLGAFAATR